MDIPFGRRRKKNTKFDFASLEKVLSGLQLYDQLPFEEEDTWGPLGLTTIHSPSEPLLEFIFIHGLGGGSRKTWSFSTKLHHFWPQEWLSKDPAFQNVRVHTFGYKSRWNDTKGSILNVHDIAESLLGALNNSPSIRSSVASRIVLIAHSMGGLVAKKAYIEARVNPNYEQLGRRIHSLYFLGTPHRGSESSKLAQTLISISPFHGEKPYLQDLNPTSAMIQLINSDFPRYSQDLKLFSFYETLETWAGSSRMIVNQQSATLGYVNEQRMPLNKNHRGLCKFEKPTDRDFITLRSALGHTVESILRDVSVQRHASHLNQLHALRDYLGVHEMPDGDLIELEDLCMPKSCSWYTSKPTFHEWRDGALREQAVSLSLKESDLFRVIWLSGMPGTGKSVLTSQVINHLESVNLDCSYYYFSSEDRTKSTISGMLRSLAYQMALLSSNVREKILTMKENGVNLEKDNDKLIWRKLFISGIFRCTFEQPQYWVIDALDECKDYSTLLPMLAKVEPSFALRILLTSRPSIQIQAQLSLLSDRIQEQQISFDDTYDSIRQFVEKGPKSKALRHLFDGAQGDLVERITQKSEGSFLWTDLVMDELANHAYSAEKVEQTLEEVPPSMYQLYERTLKSLSKPEIDGDDRKQVSKAILNFVACAFRPLTVLELADALRIEFNITIFEHTIKSSCGNLIYVDKMKRVCLIHKTVRDFLLSPDLASEFRVDLADANLQLGSACLKFLRSSHMRPKRTQGLSGRSVVRIERRITDCPFAEYACIFFSDHVRRIHSDDTESVDQLHAFLTTNSFSWIEHIAYRGELGALVRASQNLHGYLQARAKYRPLLDQKTQVIQKWSVDLIRLVAKFGKNLLRCPSSIFSLIPPLSPPESAIACQHTDLKGIKVMGLSRRVWDDRLCSIYFNGETATAIAYGDSSFAVGLHSGAVYIYDYITFQELRVLQHEESVKILRYNLTGDLLACGGLRKLRLWNVADGNQIWLRNTPGEPLDLSFADQDQNLMAITRSNNILIRRTADGESVSTKLRKNHLRGAVSLFRGGDITSASFSLALNMLATIHRGQPVTLTDLDNDEYIGFCEKDITSDDSLNMEQPVEAITAMKFNPNPDIGLLAVTYIDGTLAIFNPDQQTLVAIVEDSEAAILASSPDGRILAVGSSAGIIMLYEFQTLRLLHRIIYTSDLNLRAMAFSSDGQRLIDIRESQCNVWAPPLLMLSEPQSTDSMSDAIAMVVEDFNSPSQEVRVEITAIACLANGDAVLCGMHDGLVVLHSTTTGKKLKNMYRHTSRYWVSDMVWNTKRGFLASVDGSNSVLVKQLQHRKEWEIASDVFTTHLTSPVKQILFNIEGSYLLVLTTEKIVVFQLQGDKVMRSLHANSIGRWVNDPTNSDQLISIEPSFLKFYNWKTLEEVSVADGIKLKCDLDGKLTIQDVDTSADGKMLVLKLSRFHRKISTTHFCLLDTSSCRTDSKEVSVLGRFDNTTAQIDHVIGYNRSTLFFLNKDLWVCSLMLSGDGNDFTRHMFIPDEWIDRSHRFIFQLTGKGDLIFVAKAEVAVIRRGVGHKAILNDS